MAHQYINAYGISVKTGADGCKHEVFLTFYQDYPMKQEDGTIKNIREPISAILMENHLAKNLSEALADLLKEQET